MWHEVYISYCPVDRRVADSVCESLESGGIRCWIAPRNLLPGVDRGEALAEAIDSSLIVVVIFSSHCNQAAEVTRDLERAVRKGKGVLQFRIEPVAPSKKLETLLAPFQTIDAYTGSQQKHLQNLVKVVQGILGGESKQSPPKSTGVSRTTLILCGVAFLIFFFLTLAGAYKIINGYTKDQPNQQETDKVIQPARSSFEGYEETGKKQYDSGNYQQAISSFDLAIQADKTNPESYYLRGNSYAKLGKFQQAVQDYNQTIKLAPENAEAFHDRGVTYSKMDQHQESISDFTQAIQLKPDYAEAYKNRAQEYSKTGNHELAINDLKQAEHLNPEILDTSAANDYYERGLTLNKQRQFTPALHDFSDAIRLDRRHSRAYNQRGVANQNLGNQEQAIFDYTQAIKINPQFAEAYCNRGALYSRESRFVEAKQDFDRCGKLDPGYRTWIKTQLQLEAEKQSQNLFKKFGKKFKKIF